MNFKNSKFLMLSFFVLFVGKVSANKQGYNVYGKNDRIQVEKISRASEAEEIDKNENKYHEHLLKAELHEASGDTSLAKKEYLKAADSFEKSGTGQFLSIYQKMLDSFMSDDFLTSEGASFAPMMIQAYPFAAHLYQKGGRDDLARAIALKGVRLYEALNFEKIMKEALLEGSKQEDVDQALLSSYPVAEILYRIAGNQDMANHYSSKIQGLYEKYPHWFEQGASGLEVI